MSGTYLKLVRMLLVLTLGTMGCNAMESSLTDFSGALDSAGKSDVAVYAIDLVDGATGASIELKNGTEIDLDGITGQLTLRAAVSSKTESVEFILNSKTTVDNAYPFEMTFQAAKGSYSVTAIAYMKTNKRGASNSKAVSFKLTDSSNDTEEPSVPVEEPTVPEEPVTPEEPSVPVEEPTVPEEPVTPEEPTMPEEPTVPEAPQNLVGNFYVSPLGSDTNDGTKSRPFKTLQKAVSVVRAGQIVIVKDGVYKESSSSDYGLLINAAGRSDAWIRIVAENRGKAVIDGNNNRIHYGVTFGASARYVSVEGFEIRGYVDGGFFSNSGAQHINMYGNTIHSIGRRCTDSQYGQSGIYLGSSVGYHTIDSNTFHTIGRYAPGENGCSPSTEYWKNHDHGIYIKGSNVNIVNNVFDNIKRGWAIHAYAADIANVKVINNTFYGANPDRDGHILLTGSNRIFSNWLIQNNIFESPRGKALSFACERVVGLKVHGNITTSTLVTGDKCFDAKSNLEKASAQMRAPASDDFTITTQSKACDVALTTNSPETDIRNAVRPANGVCAGAYQP